MARRGGSRRWCTGFVGVALLGVLLFPASALAERPVRMDSISGSGTTDLFGQVVVDATSGANGESPIGQVTATGGPIAFDGPVVCLHADGNEARVHVQSSPFGLLLIVVRDNASTGTVDEIEVGPSNRAPADCSAFGSGGSSVAPLTSGDITVVDAAGRPPRRNRLSRQVSGSAEGTDTFVFDPTICPFVFQVFDLGYVAESGGTGSLHLEGCVDGAAFAYQAAFTLTTPSGAVLTGTTTGTALPFNLVLEVTSSEGPGFRNVRGTITLMGAWSGGGPDGPPGVVTGTLVGDLERVRP